MAVIQKRALAGTGLGCVHVNWPPMAVGDVYMCTSHRRIVDGYGRLGLNRNRGEP
jgi:hypothetical protein